MVTPSQANTCTTANEAWRQTRGERTRRWKTFWRRDTSSIRAGGWGEVMEKPKLWKIGMKNEKLCEVYVSQRTSQCVRWRLWGWNAFVARTHHDEDFLSSLSPLASEGWSPEENLSFTPSFLGAPVCPSSFYLSATGETRQNERMWDRQPWNGGDSAADCVCVCVR